MILSFIAIPGAGKSTQINKLIEANIFEDLISISIPSLYNRRTHDIMSYLTEEEKEIINEVKNESDLSRKIGNLAPIVLDKILFNLAIRLSKMGKIVVIDGGPRGLEQAKMFMDVIPKEELKKYKIIELYFENDEERISKERQYYRTIENKKIDIDDAIAKINKIPNKISVYINDTRAGVKYLEERGVNVGRFVATDSIDYIHNNIINYILDK